jgi:tRNA (adenine57-N1/adenine58-N1)-methyltransferase
VLLYVDERRSRIFRAVKGRRVSTDKGYLVCDDIIGLPWGSKARLSTGFEARLLRPTLPDLLMKGFKRVTQVIYPKDLSLLVMLSGIGPGSRVLDSGVGTGFLTAVLAHYVGPEGKVYGYEMREDFAKTASSDLEIACLRSRVEIKVRDVREGVEERDLDAAFLDIPDPWNALTPVWHSLKPSAPLLVFTPTANQVIKFLKALKTASTPFVDQRVYEVILRDYQPDPEALRPKTISVTHTGYLIYSRKALE